MPEIHLNTSLMLAFLLGALHVLEPAHGRSIIHALIVGSQGNKLDVFKFGGSVVVSHLLIAAIIASAMWYAGAHFASGVLAPTIKIIGALATLGIGILMITCGRGQHTTCSHRHGHLEDARDPRHEEVHAAHMLQAHMVNPTILGVTGGLIPCQGTIALIFQSVGQGNIQSAVGLMVAFALGLGGCLIIIGLLTIIASSRAEKLSGRLGSTRFLSYAPGVVVIVMASLALYNSIGEFGHEGHQNCDHHHGSIRINAPDFVCLLPENR